MDLRREFHNILAEYGHDILLVREDTRLRCSCWNEKTQEADRECGVCYGLGYAPIVEKHTVRNVDTSVPETLAMLGESGGFGDMNVPGRYYYMKHNVKVAIGSLLVDVDWSSSGKPIYTGRGVYEVSHIDPQRFRRGEIIFNKVYVKDQPVEKEIRGIRIANANGIKNYEIITKE